MIASLVIFRPLLLTSAMPEVAEARGVSTHRVEIVFLLVMALTTSMTVPVVGALLMFSLMIGPAPRPPVVHRRPGLAITVSVAFGLVTVWIGIAVSYETNWPLGLLRRRARRGVLLVGRAWAALRGRRVPRAAPRRQPSPAPASACPLSAPAPCQRLASAPTGPSAPRTPRHSLTALRCAVIILNENENQFHARRNMSLDVAPELLDQATRGEVDEGAFVDTVRVSLPYAYELIASLTARLRASVLPFADNEVPPASRGRARPAAPRPGQRRDPRQSGASLRRAARVPELPPGRRLPARTPTPPSTRASPRRAPRSSTSRPSCATADRRSAGRRRARARPSRAAAGPLRDNGRRTTGRHRRA